jgi:hypothetical protein
MTSVICDCQIVAKRWNMRAAFVGDAEHRTRFRIGVREAKKLRCPIARQDRKIALHITVCEAGCLPVITAIAASEPRLDPC